MRITEQRQYWKRQLEGVAAPQLAIGKSSPRATASTTAIHTFAIPQNVIRRVAELADQHDVSLLDLAVAAFQIVLARYTGVDDIAVAMPAPGRSHPLVLRSRVMGSSSVLDFLLDVRATVAAAFAHADVPFDSLVADLGLEPKVGRAMVACDDAALNAAEVGVRLIERDADIVGTVEYRADLFDAAAIERLAGHVTHVLDVATADPAIALRDLDVLTEAERRVLAEWSGTERSVVAVTLPGLFESAVVRFPDLPAVVF
ncbi:MAG TPA: condensation domain-containing protein, partial [Kribbella sp.]